MRLESIPKVGKDSIKHSAIVCFKPRADNRKMVIDRENDHECT